MGSREDYITGLDLGSTKTCALVATPLTGGKLQVAGFGVAESKGWRRGAIVNLDSALLSIKKAVEAAEDAAGVSIDNAYVGVGGCGIRGINAKGSFNLGKPHQATREVTGEDVRKVFMAAQAVNLPPDRKVIYAERQEYLLNSQNGIRNPVGMVGGNLEVKTHLVTASTTAHENVVAAVNRAGIVVNETIFEGLAAAEACLTPDERELGVALVDVGGGNSNLIVYREGSVRYSGAIPVGGDHFTNDLAVGLRTPIPEAEKMKLAWGRRDPSQPEDESLEVPSVGERPSRTANYSMLREIIEPRLQELVELIAEQLESSGLGQQLGGGIVLTGGGGKLGGLAGAAEHTLGLPVRLGVPGRLEKMGDVVPDAAYSTVVGLVIHGYRLQLLRETHGTGLGGKLWGILRGKN
ncbi:MAG: cell division protein FtsA [Terriglobia bacterium]